MIELLQGIISFLFLGTALRIALRLVYGPFGPADDDLCYFVILLMSRLLVWFAVGTGLIVFFGSTGYVVWIIAALVGNYVWDQLVLRRQRTLLSVLAALIDAGLPLPAALEALAAEQRGAAGRQTERLAERLKQGQPLAAAIRRSGSALPYSTPAYAAVGEALDALPESLRRNIADDQRQSQFWLTASSRLMYLAALVLMMVAVITFCMIKIVPAYFYVFEDYDLELPAMTYALVEAAESAKNLSLLVIPALLVAAYLLLFAIARRLGWIRNIPLVSRWFSGHHRSTVLGVLALAAERQQPLAPVLHTLGEEFPLHKVSWRLRLAAADISAGCPVWDSLRVRKLIGRTECAVLEAAERAGNLPWALVEMSGHAARREISRLQALMEVAFPLVIMTLSLVVAFFAIALFYPLVTLIFELL